MPIKIPNELPAANILESENIFVMTQTRALSQDIRPLRLLIVNLMPTKIVTETQLLRALSNTPLQIDPDFVAMESHTSKNTPQEHLINFYTPFSEIKDKKYDGVIITGAPVEMFEFEEVDYWDELCEIFEWTKTNATSTFHICWAAQAALYYHYGIKKHMLDKKLFGVFRHKTLNHKSRLIRGFDETFLVPHSRHTTVLEEDIRKINGLEILASSDEAGVYLIKSTNDKFVFATGHSEYDSSTLKLEYERDLEKGIGIEIPKNYFPNDDPSKKPVNTWRAHNHLLFTNWLNYFVYQTTPYSIEDVGKRNENS